MYVCVFINSEYYIVCISFSVIYMEPIMFVQFYVYNANNIVVIT